MASCFSFNRYNEKLSSRCGTPEDDDGESTQNLSGRCSLSCCRIVITKLPVPDLKNLPKLLAVTCESCHLGPRSCQLSPCGTSPFIRLPPLCTSLPHSFSPSLPNPDPAIWGKQMILMRDGSPSPGTKPAHASATPLIARHRPRCPSPDTDTFCCANTMNGTLRGDNRRARETNQNTKNHHRTDKSWACFGLCGV